MKGEALVVSLLTLLDDTRKGRRPSFTDEADRLPFDGKHFEAIFTPGHTKGSICLKYGNLLLSGDTFFYRFLGRTDLPTGSLEQLERSIRTKFYTGHGDPTTIGEEKKHNGYVRA